MAHTTLASTDRALEKIGEFVALQDYPSLKAVGRTFAQKVAVLVGFRRSIPKRYAKKAKRRLPAVNSQGNGYVVRDFVGDDDDAATVVADEPFPVGATVELHGLPPHPNFDLNGRHVVVVPTPLDVAARGRINVVLDGAVHAVQREYLRAVATP